MPELMHTVSTVCNGVRHEFRFAEDDASAVLGAVLDADYLDWWAMHELYVQIRDIIGPSIVPAMNRVCAEKQR